MPRSVQELLEDAEELATRFEKYDPVSRTNATPRPTSRCATTWCPGPLQNGHP